MSRIYFHAQHRTAEVGGSERHYMRLLATDIGLSVIRLNSMNYELLKPFVRGAPEMPENPPDWLTWKSLWRILFANDDISFRISDEWVSSVDMSLNTMIAMNSPQLSFMAHVYGTCESHGYVFDHNAKWLHKVIERGRADNLLRAGQGWEDVMALALEVDKLRNGEIVMSYSVEQSFPNPSIADWQGSQEEWYALPSDNQWLLATAGLLAKDWPFAMGPNQIDQGFMSGKSAFDLMAQIWSGQLAGKES